MEGVESHGAVESLDQMWQSYVAQLQPRLRSGGVSCAAHRGVRQMPSSFELLGIAYGLGCDKATLPSQHLGFGHCPTKSDTI